jgi:hypothetical protein
LGGNTRFCGGGGTMITGYVNCAPAGAAPPRASASPTAKRKALALIMSFLSGRAASGMSLLRLPAIQSPKRSFVDMPMRIAASCRGRRSLGWKTTSATILATVLAGRGASVTVIDADPNQNVVDWAKLPGKPAHLDIVGGVTEETIVDAIEAATTTSAFVIVDLEGTASLMVSTRQRALSVPRRRWPPPRSPRVGTRPPRPRMCGCWP